MATISENGASREATQEELDALAATQATLAADALTAWRASASLTFAQMLIGLDAEEWITTAEADDWLDGTLPAPALTLIAGLPASQQFAARARAKRPSIILRNDPLVIGLGALQGKTAEELDTFFQTYASV